MKERRRQPADKPAGTDADSDLAVLDREEDRDRTLRDDRIERRDWRGEGVVGNYHTD